MGEEHDRVLASNQRLQQPIVAQNKIMREDGHLQTLGGVAKGTEQWCKLCLTENRSGYFAKKGLLLACIHLEGIIARTVRQPAKNTCSPAAQPAETGKQ